MSDSPNFLTYAQTAFDPFEERPFCAVDSLVFAWLSYLRLPGDMAELTNWQGLDVRELLRAECYQDMIGDLWDPEGSRALSYFFRRTRNILLFRIVFLAFILPFSLKPSHFFWYYAFVISSVTNTEPFFSLFQIFYPISTYL